VRTAVHRRDPRIIDTEDAEHTVGAAYNEAGARYVEYADGNPEKLFSFDGQYAYGDRYTWKILEARMQALRLSGSQTLRVLDLGCGPGTWLRRIVTRAMDMGFKQISARGVDIADAQVRRAREFSRNLIGRPGIDLKFEVGDIRDRFIEPSASVDLCLCLYAVINHIPKHEMAFVVREIARVTSGDFITTVRSVGSTPTIYVGPVSSATSFHQDNRADRLDVELRDGRHASFSSHLFSSDELKMLVAPYFTTDDVRGLDLFHGRFAADPRWNPATSTSSRAFSAELEKIEAAYCRNPEFIDHATHLLLIARRRRGRDTRFVADVRYADRSRLEASVRVEPL
jgi:SAM-dependent methyltransferase